VADAASPVSDGLDVCEGHCRIFDGLLLYMSDSYFDKCVLGVQLNNVLSTIRISARYELYV
jgi:hypothetical protein